MAKDGVPKAPPAATLNVGVVFYENTPQETERLAASLEACARENATPRLTVSFLDNSPTAALQPVVERLGIGAYRRSERNLGFGAAHNVLMADAFQNPAVRHYVCLNPDGMLHPECLGALVEQAESRERVGLVEALQFPDEHPKPYDPKTFETPWCSGCALLVTRALYEAVGGFDERLFMYCEDVDLSWRARAASFLTLVASRALVHHHVSHRKPSKRVTTHMLRSGAYLGQKYGNASFAASCLAELGRREPSTDEPPSFERVPPPSERMRSVADFDHLFHFAGVRW